MAKLDKQKFLEIYDRIHVLRVANVDKPKHEYVEYGVFIHAMSFVEQLLETNPDIPMPEFCIGEKKDVLIKWAAGVMVSVFTPDGEAILHASESARSACADEDSLFLRHVSKVVMAATQASAAASP